MSIANYQVRKATHCHINVNGCFCSWLPPLVIVIWMRLIRPPGRIAPRANVIVAKIYLLKETAMKNDATTRPQANQAPVRLSKGDFVTVLRKLLQDEAKAGKSSVDVRAANLHTEVGVYPARGHSMPTCCTVMYEEMQPGDEILLTPPGGKGATLLVRYKLPR